MGNSRAKMSQSVQISNALLEDNLEWAKEIVEPLNHALGHQWSASILPNNFIFYLRSEEKRMRATSVGANLHGAYELVIALSGKGRACLKKEVYEMTQGNAFLVRPGEFHYYFGFNRRPFSWLIFKFDLSETEAVQLPEIPVCSLLEEDLVFLLRMGEKYNQEIQTERNLYEIGAGMGDFLERIGRRPACAPIGNRQDDEFRGCRLLYRITQFLVRNLDQVVRIRNLADYLEVSESNLRKVFREEFHTSLGGYLRGTRFARGEQLLRGTQMSISEISQLSGFESVASFSQAYRKAYGVTPTQYRQEFLDALAVRAGGAAFATRALWNIQRADELSASR